MAAQDGTLRMTDARSAPPDATAASRGERVYRAILEALRNGELKAGDRVREQDLAERLGVSRTPVREALGRLLGKGLLTSIGGRGLVVRSLAAGEVVDLYIMREIIEGAAARLAAQHASAPEIAALADIHARFLAHLDDEALMAGLNRQFHDAIHRAARNPYLDVASGELQDTIALLGATTFSVEGRPDSAAREHAEILAAIEARDADRAEQLARAHIRGALRARLAIVGNKAG